MSIFNDVPFNIILRQGTDANLQKSTTFFQQGEPAYTTDTRRVYVSDGTGKHVVSSNLIRINGNGVSNDYLFFINSVLSVGSGTVLGYSINGVLGP
jgi:Major tropism determinant N-terminal domain